MSGFLTTVALAILVGIARPLIQEKDWNGEYLQEGTSIYVWSLWFACLLWLILAPTFTVWNDNQQKELGELRAAGRQSWSRQYNKATNNNYKARW